MSANEKEAWAVTNKNGEVAIRTIGRSMTAARTQHERQHKTLWDFATKRGYKLVKVKIEIVEVL